MPIPSSRQTGKISVFDAAGHQRIFDLQIADRMHGVGAADSFGADFRKADVTDITGLHHLGDGADSIFDRHGRIEPRRTIDIDMIRPQPAQAVGQKILTAAGRAS